MEAQRISVRTGPRSCRAKIRTYPGEWLLDAYELALEKQQDSLWNESYQTDDNGGLSVPEMKNEDVTNTPAIGMSVDNAQRKTGKPTQRDHKRIEDLYLEEEQDRG